GNLEGKRLTADPETDDEAFWILVFAGLGLAGRFGMQEKSSAPHARLAYVHLQSSSLTVAKLRLKPPSVPKPMRRTFATRCAAAPAAAPKTAPKALRQKLVSFVKITAFGDV